MNPTLKMRIIWIIVLGIPLVFGVVSLAFFQYHTQVKNTERLERAGEVAKTLDRLFGRVLHASNRSRRYTLSGDRQYLQEYHTAVAGIPDLLAQLRHLTQADAADTAALQAFEQALEQKLALQRTLIQTYQQQGFDPARDLLVQDVGLELERFRDQMVLLRSTQYRVASHFLGEFRDGLLLQLAVILVLVLAGIIWITMLSTTAIQGILTPVRGMIDHVKQLGSDNDVPDLPVLRDDEIGELAVHINALTHSLWEANAAREAARVALVTERQNLVDAVEALEEGFAAFDAHERLIRCNQKFREIYPELTDLAVSGVTMETLLARRAEFGREHGAKGREQDWVAEKLADFRNPGGPTELLMEDGRTIRKAEYRSRGGGTVGVYVDITQIKATEAALRDLNTKLDQRVTDRTNALNTANQQLELLNIELSTLIGSAPVAIIALNNDGKISIWNPTAERLTGHSHAETHGQALPTLAAAASSADFEALLSAVQTGAAIENVELLLQHRSGAPFTASCSAAALWDKKKSLQGVIIIFTDLTESRALQDQFQQSQKMEIVAELTAGLAHDFNNLLAIVISNLDMLVDKLPKQGEAAELTRAALRASLSGVSLNRQLLAFSKHQTLRPVNVDIGSVINGLTTLLHPTLGEHVDYKFHVPPGLWPVLVDPTLLESAILNLAVNARDAMQDGGLLTISARNQTLPATPAAGPTALTGECVVLTVTDTGVGMSGDVVERVFEPFFTTKGFGKGSGLGLSMVYGFVHQSGGNVMIESVPGTGTQIHIQLPRAKRRAGQLPEAEIDGGAAAGAGQTVLVVEDNASLRLAVARQLQEMGYQTIQVESTRSAIRVLESDATVDVMLTDIVMPGGMDGRGLARAAVKLRADLPIILTSGFPNETNTAGADGDNGGQGRDDGDGAGDAWSTAGMPVLAKPVRRDALARRLQQVLTAAALPPTGCPQPHGQL